MVDGQHVPLSPEGIERAGSDKVGKKLVEAVRAEADRATDGQCDAYSASPTASRACCWSL
jgi:hypothetical protein